MVGKTALNKERYHLNGGPFQTLEVLLRNEHSHLKQLNDTLSVDSNVAYVPFNCNNRIIKATFVQYPQAGKGNKYLTTKDSI